MKRVPIWIDGEITVREIATLFTNAGYHLHSDGLGRTVVDRVPGIVKKDPPQTNVLRMPTRVRGGGKR